MDSAPRPPITDSPWFWVYVFSTAALIALILISHQYGQRQARLERQYSAKERAGQVPVRDPSDDTLAEPENTLITLRPLYVAAAVVAIVGWVFLWLHHFRRSGRQRPATGAGQGAEP